MRLINGRLVADPISSPKPATTAPLVVGPEVELVNGKPVMKQTPGPKSAAVVVGPRGATGDRGPVGPKGDAGAPGNEFTEMVTDPVAYYILAKS